MEYIVGAKFNKESISGKLNLAKGTTCVEENNVIYYGDKPVCYATSQNAYDYFSRNDDGKGQKRYDKVHAILNKINALVIEYNEDCQKIISEYTGELSEEQSEEMQNRINLVVNKVKNGYNAIRIDPQLRHLLKIDSDVFNYYFYNADIETLEKVSSLFN